MALPKLDLTFYVLLLCIQYDPRIMVSTYPFMCYQFLYMYDEFLGIGTSSLCDSTPILC